MSPLSNPWLLKRVIQHHGSDIHIRFNVEVCEMSVVLAFIFLLWSIFVYMWFCRFHFVFMEKTTYCRKIIYYILTLDFLLLRCRRRSWTWMGGEGGAGHGWRQGGQTRDRLPLLYEGHDVTSCLHLEEENPFEPHGRYPQLACCFFDY